MTYQDLLNKSWMLLTPSTQQIQRAGWPLAVAIFQPAPPPEITNDLIIRFRLFGPSFRRFPFGFYGFEEDDRRRSSSAFTGELEDFTRMEERKRNPAPPPRKLTTRRSFGS